MGGSALYDTMECVVLPPLEQRIICNKRRREEDHRLRRDNIDVASQCPSV
ncbi:hypothetical protein WG66_009204 [Moniliophthora roreri]|nr:hypothetical protein WG66_009204 [Moniliophthora roreri]